MDDRILYLVDLLNDDLSDSNQRVDCYADAHKIYFHGGYAEVSADIYFTDDVIEFSNIEFNATDYTTPTDTGYVLGDLEIIFDIIDSYHGSILMM